jgi:myosin heavy subunit
MPPHYFATAEAAFSGLLDERADQSIIISGESGAGKTEATKKCVQYIASVAGSLTGVENRIMKASPILEAFGNAKTIRNNNSSRFGKWQVLSFDTRGRIL